MPVPFLSADPTPFTAACAQEVHGSGEIPPDYRNPEEPDWVEAGRWLERQRFLYGRQKLLLLRVRLIKDALGEALRGRPAGGGGDCVWAGRHGPAAGTWSAHPLSVAPPLHLAALHGSLPSHALPPSPLCCAGVQLVRAHSRPRRNLHRVLREGNAQFQEQLRQRQQQEGDEDGALTGQQQQRQRQQGQQRQQARQQRQQAPQQQQAPHEQESPAQLEWW